MVSSQSSASPKVDAISKNRALRRQPELLNLVQAGEYLGRSERYMRRLVAERRVPHYVVGRRLRFDVRDLD